MISIVNLDKALVLKALVDHATGSSLCGIGCAMTAMLPTMTIEDAKRMIGGSRDLYFDYVAGRAIKVDLSRDEFCPRLYDRDHGHGRAAVAIDSLKGGLS